MVPHKLHTPIIGIPILRFADLVFRDPALDEFQPLAQWYVQSFEESCQNYQSSWQEDGAGGYFVFEPGGKFWASGLPVPYNALSANGVFLLYLWRVTGKVEYIEKTAALARKIREGITFLSDGTMTMPYWVRDSLPYTGWKGLLDNPVNGLYNESEPDPAAEEISHFSLTLRFAVEAWQEGLVFQEDDLRAVAQTFTSKIWRPFRGDAYQLCDPDWRRGFYLAHNLDGKGMAYDYAIATFALLWPWEPQLVDQGLEVYHARYN